MEDSEKNYEAMQARIEMLERKNEGLERQLEEAHEVKKEISFTLRQIVNFCHTKMEISEVKPIVDMLNYLMRMVATKEEYDLVDSIEPDCRERIRRQHQVLVQGDYVERKHVEHEVGNVESGGIGIQVVNGNIAKPTASKEKPAMTDKTIKKTEPANKQRETMTFRRTGGVTDGHLTLLFMELCHEGWIEGSEECFKALFSGQRDKDCTLTWMGTHGKGTLVELFRQLMGAKLIALPEGYSLPAVLEGHFKDKNGQPLRGLDKGDKPKDKALPLIEGCVRLLKMNPKQLMEAEDQEEEEDIQSVYDYYDQQDLHLRKRG